MEAQFVRWQQVEDDLRALWRHAPLTDEKIERYAPHLSALFTPGQPAGTEDGDLVERLRATLYRLNTGEEIDALIAVLGLDEAIQQDTVDERMLGFAVLRMDEYGHAEMRDARTIRRRAERGTKTAAQFIVRDLVADYRDRIEVRIWGSLEETHCSVTFRSVWPEHSVKADLASLVWSEWQQVETIAKSAEALKRDSEAEYVDDPEEALVTYESVGSLRGNHGSAWVRIYTYESPQPYFSLSARPDFHVETFVDATNEGFKVTIEVPRGAWREMLEGATSTSCKD